MSEPKPCTDEAVAPKDGDELPLEELEKVTGGVKTTTTDLKNDPKFKEAVSLGMKTGKLQ